MKTLKDQKTDLENTIATKRARLEEIMTTVAGEGRSTDDDEGREYDAIEGEVTKMVADVGRLERAMASQTLTPVGDGQSVKSVQGSRLPVLVKNTEKDDGLGIARVARVMALAKTGQAGTNDMIQIAKAIYPDRENVLKSFMAMNRVNKAVVHAANTMDTDWAQALITDGGAPFADFVEYLRPRFVVFGCLQQLGRYLHRIGGGEQGDFRHPIGITRGALESDQRTHAVADDRGFAHPGGVLHREHPIGQCLDARKRRPRAAAMAGQVEREHAVAVVREIAALQHPYAVVVFGAMHEHHGGQLRVELLAAAVGVGMLVVHCEQH
jgi:hypothetical protein